LPEQRARARSGMEKYFCLELMTRFGSAMMNAEKPRCNPDSPVPRVYSRSVFMLG
jgi:hypothetical protein